MDIPQLYRRYWVLIAPIYESQDDPYLVIHDGLGYTAMVLYYSEEQNGTDQTEMTLNTPPSSAFQYCWNKNVRSSDNIVDYGINVNDRPWLGDQYYYEDGTIKGKWFLPGIRQMEQSLLAYYSTFPEFQGNFYWSSSAAEEWGETSGQQRDYARATRIDQSGGYVLSGGDRGGGEPWLWPDYGGYAPRTEDGIRIRAFRIDLEPYDY